MSEVLRSSASSYSESVVSASHISFSVVKSYSLSLAIGSMSICAMSSESIRSISLKGLIDGRPLEPSLRASQIPDFFHPPMITSFARGDVNSL